MNKAIPFLCLITISTHTYAISESQIESIRQLGEFNGVALKCHYLKVAKKIKHSLAERLPKQRELGEMFEVETNRSFLNFIQHSESCPGEAGFQNSVQQAIGTLHQQFPVTP